MSARVVPMRPAPVVVDGRQPPHDLEVEAALIATCIWQPGSIAEIFSIARPEDFYSRVHEEIARAMLWVATEGRTVDVFTLETRLKDTGRFSIVGEGFIVRMLSQTARLARPRQQAETVRDKAVLRRLAVETMRICASAYEPQEDPRALLSDCERIARDLAEMMGRGGGMTLLEIAKAMAHRQGAPAQPVITTGFPWLDRALRGGWRPGQVFYVGARPETGKSVLAGQFALAAMDAGKRTVISCMEMPHDEILERLACTRAQISYERFIDGDPSLFTPFNMAVSEMVAAKRLDIDDRASMSVLDLEALAVSKKAQILIVDYLQLIKPSKTTRNNRSRQEEVAEMSRELKTMAMRLKIPVIVLCQLSRLSAREERRPTDTDLRESGALEQDADGVLLLWRPYCKNPDASPEDRASGELILSKLRRGGGGRSVPIRLAPHGFVEAEWP